jgi:hypothetical protein
VTGIRARFFSPYGEKITFFFFSPQELLPILKSKAKKNSYSITGTATALILSIDCSLFKV